MSKAKWNRASWVSLSPNGLGHIKPNHYFEIARTIWRNRDQLPFAWRILTQGVCDGCALGTAGVRDFTMDGVHLCMVRLDLLRLNTMPALDASLLDDAEVLSQMTASELRDLGRIPYPMIRRLAERGFRRVSWDEALDCAASAIRKTSPQKLAFYLTSRGITNEVYYVAQKVARFLGTNNVDNSSRICHAPSTVALKESLGVAASTCSYTDWIGSDLLVFFGSNTPNNQPVTTKYIYHAKKQGARVAVVNPYREPGLERYWVPSVLESALFGTRIADAFFQVNTGGDQAFIAGVLKMLISNNWIDNDFVSRFTRGFDELKSSLDAIDWELIEAASGSTRDEMLRFARLLGEVRSAVFVWSMGITQHQDGVANVSAIVNLALSRGFIGRPNCGLMPIRGHSGVQGGAEVGAVPNQLPGGTPVGDEGSERFARLWGFDVSPIPGLNAVEMINAANDEQIDVLYQIGGNFLETLPEPHYVREAIERIPVRIHQDIVLTPQMMVEPKEVVVLFPAQTRYEQRGGGTETSTERRILFSPEIRGRRIGESKAEWEIPMLLAERVRPADRSLIHFDDSDAIRIEIAKAVPAYVGIEKLARTGDQVQWGGSRLCEETNSEGTTSVTFPTPDGRAVFAQMNLEFNRPNGLFRLSTRRGKQFNSMVHREVDPLTGAMREDVLISAADCSRLGISNGDRITVKADSGELHGRARIADIAPGNVQVHWPEGNVLIKRGRSDKRSGIPDFNAEVEICPDDSD
jgi:molybdopterin-dependent oxidoreductase alpha subunit